MDQQAAAESQLEELAGAVPQEAIPLQFNTMLLKQLGHECLYQHVNRNSRACRSLLESLALP